MPLVRQPEIRQVFLNGCQKTEIRFSAEMPNIDGGSIDFQITKPKPDPTHTEQSKETIKPTASGDEASYGDSEAVKFVSNTVDDYNPMPELEDSGLNGWGNGESSLV